MRAILLGSYLGAKRERNRLLREIHPQPSDLLIAVDGGAQGWLESGIQPTFAVGDWDSLSSPRQILARMPHVTIPVKKDRSDLFYALAAAVWAGAKELICLGVTGGRPDHHLASLMDLSTFSTGKYGKLISVQAVGAEGTYVFLSTRIPVWRGTLPRGTCVSVFAMSPRVQGVTLRGFHYRLSNSNLMPSSWGLSNWSEQRKCEVYLRKGQLVIIMPKNGVLSAAGQLRQQKIR